MDPNKIKFKAELVQSVPELVKEFEQLTQDAEKLKLHASSRTIRLDFGFILFRLALDLVTLFGAYSGWKVQCAEKLLDDSLHVLAVLRDECKTAVDQLGYQRATVLLGSVEEWKKNFQVPTAGEKRAIFRAMSHEVGYNNNNNNNNEGTYGGHWYECENGHPYTIGECGGAMQRSMCLECGVPIGGGSHRLTAGNRRATSLLREVDDNFRG
mmetsp:Transcript_39753/g.100158  ORF Transcript_39753/g.100158 Transcript_39753/m.100158 type:complete len:211 (+) Transcript_39753:2122-2754(+)